MPNILDTTKFVFSKWYLKKHFQIKYDKLINYTQMSEPDAYVDADDYILDLMVTVSVVGSF